MFQEVGKWLKWRESKSKSVTENKNREEKTFAREKILIEIVQNLYIKIITYYFECPQV